MIDPSHPPKIWGYAFSPETTPEQLARSRRLTVPPSTKATLSGYREGNHRLALVWLEFPASRLRVVSVAYWVWDHKEHCYRTVCYDRMSYTQPDEGESDEHFAHRMGHEFVQMLCATKEKTVRDRLDMLVFP